MLERGRDYAHFRLVIIEGKVYIEKYKRPYQTRDLFTVWGILQLLRLYPGKVSDLELMFWCDDRPVIMKSDYEEQNSTLPLPPPPVFHYCGHQEAFDIVFPDWTFWGWAETNIKPWTSTLEDIRKGNKRTIWEERIPYAYWKGNPNVSLTRKDLMKCNSTRDKYDWNSRLYTQDWDKEIEKGYKNSKLEDQCTHRYKIYVEGRSWSVSDKYILACDSMTLMIEPEYYDFYLRSLVPLQHYWPIRTTRKCRDIKFAVEWGNRHSRQARAIGRAGSKYVEEQLKMKYVYDYMFHLLNEYAKLLNFKPRVPKRARKMCSQKLLCLQSQHGLWKKFMVESMVNSSSETLACNMPPPFEPLALEAFFESKEIIKKQVEMWETEFWENLNQDH
ncbi:O-glucosyltransferase rumi-like [Melia azedarach]|uniref:O-glucosyltransferase rumi-like n=1 Tax=Melia azedarach TaxID=155640 RepID=A0ACC1YU06_MELAZ|nr:O-glucosyltransferase rumi-like [Melia azedarach]